MRQVWGYPAMVVAGPFFMKIDIYAFYESISHQAEAACKRELELANNGHKICHIVSLATSFNITLLHLLHTTLGIISGKIKNTTLKVDANLCGLISAPVSAGNNSDLALLPHKSQLNDMEISYARRR